jgi:L-amino acid N-acyltransferase YncA
MIIRDAVAADLKGIYAIYNDVLRTSNAIFSENPVSNEERLDWWKLRSKHGYPTVVASEQNAILGFASFGDFRSSSGYRSTVEHTDHVHRSWRGRGVETALVEELISRAHGAGKHVMVGGVDADNQSSLRFHERLGSEPVAHLREVGCKHDRSLDLIFLQYWLTPSTKRKGVDQSWPPSEHSL